MDFFSKIVAKVGGDQALDLVNEKLTPLLLDSFKPRISEYVNTHVERTRGELFQQLPDGVRNVLNDIVPGGLGSQRGASDVARGFMDDIANQIRQKLDKILDETRQRVHDVVQDVTSSTSDRVTRSVVGIAQNKLKLKTREVQDNTSSGEASRGFNFGEMGGSGDFIDKFINSSLEEVRPLVRGELKSVYDHIVDLIPQDARKILASLVPGLEDNQGSQGNDQNSANYEYNNASAQFSQANAPNYQNNQNQQYNSAPQVFPQANAPNYQNLQYNSAPQGFPQANVPNYQNLQYNNAPQGFPQANAPSYQNNQNQCYNDAPFGFHTGNAQNYQSQQYNSSSRGLPQENEVTSRGFMSDLKKLAHQVKDTVKSELKVGGFDGTRGGAELLQEFQAKALEKISKITTDLMNKLEGTIMATVSEELRTVAKDKLANKISF